MVQLLNLVPAFTVVAPIDSLLSIGELHDIPHRSVYAY